MGSISIFVGYAINNTGYTYRMWQTRSRRILFSRDVIWLKRMYYQLTKKIREIMVHHIRAQESESEDEDSISDNVETIEDYSVCNIDENE